MARSNTQLITPPVWQEGQPSRVDLPRQNNVRAYLLRLTGALKITGGTGAGKYLENGIWRLLRQIQVRVGGRDVMNFSGPFLFLYLYLFQAEARIQTEPESVAKDSSNPIDLWAELPLYLPHSVNPDEFGFPTSRLPNPELIPTYGRAVDLVKGSDGVPSLEGMAAQLYQVYHDDTTRAPGSYRPLLITQVDRAIVSTGPEPIQLSALVAGDEVRAVFIEALAGGANGTGHEYADDLVETVRFNMSGRAVREEVPFALIQQDNVVDYRLDTGIMPGVAVLDAAPTGQTGAGQMWTVEGHVSPTLDLKVNKLAGDCKVRVTVIYARGRLVQR